MPFKTSAVQREVERMHNTSTRRSRFFALRSPLFLPITEGIAKHQELCTRETKKNKKTIGKATAIRTHTQTQASAQIHNNTPTGGRQIEIKDLKRSVSKKIKWRYIKMFSSPARKKKDTCNTEKSTSVGRLRKKKRRKKTSDSRNANNRHHFSPPFVTQRERAPGNESAPEQIHRQSLQS